MPATIMPFGPHDAYTLLELDKDCSSENIELAYELKLFELGESSNFTKYDLDLARDLLLDPFQRRQYDNRAGIEEPRSRSPNKYFDEDEDVKVVKRAKEVRKGGSKWRAEENRQKGEEKKRATQGTNEEKLVRTLTRLDTLLTNALKQR